MLFKFKRNTYKNKIKFEAKFFGKTITFSFKFRKKPEKIIEDMLSLRHYASELALANLKGKCCINMQGRLGNQMFIHAFGKYLLDQNPNVSLIYQTTYCNYELDKYGINIDLTNIKYNNLLEEKYKANEKDFGRFEPEISASGALYYWGYFQTEKYFKKHRNELIEEFRFKIPLPKEYQEYLEKIEHSNSVLINFRGTDYKNLGWCIDFSYYEKAIKYILSTVENPKFFVFSDDIEFVKSNFKTDYELNFVDIGKNNPNKPYFDMELMKKCKHDIIPNSTFSWWAAWLNENSAKVVVAPEPWLFRDSDIVPEDWVKIEASKIPCKNPHIV